jgi:membrane associated rhomboid family serine protease
VSPRTDTRPYATLALIAACVVVFVYQESLSAVENGRFIYETGLIPVRLLGTAHLPASLATVPAPATLLTSMFVHSGFVHILVNMVVLFSFGILVERLFGWPRFLILYFVSGVASGLVHTLFMPGSEVPVIGASGAISGVLAAAFLAAPRLRIILFVIPMPFYVAMAILVAAHILFIVTGWLPGIAWWAHLGGLATGGALYLVLRPPRRRPRPFT